MNRTLIMAQVALLFAAITRIMQKGADGLDWLAVALLTLSASLNILNLQTSREK